MKIIFKNLTHLIGKKKLFRFEKAMSMIWWNFKLYLCVGFLPLKESRWSSWPWKIPALMVGVQFSCWSNVQHTHHNATLSNQHRTNTQFYVICSKHLSAVQWPLHNIIVKWKLCNIWIYRYIQIRRDMTSQCILLKESENDYKPKLLFVELP